MYYFELFEAFYNKNIKYLISGGLAVNLYGIPRVTMDVDLIIDLEEKNVHKINAVFKELNYMPIYPGVNIFSVNKIDYWIKEKNMIAFSFKNKNEPYKQVDILLPFSKNFEKFWINKEIRTINSIEIYLISKNDLIKIKNNSNRLQDKKDVELLKKVKNGKI